MQGIEIHPRFVTATDFETIEDVAGSRTYATAMGATSFITPRAVATPLPTTEQIPWDGRDVQAHALIALSVKRSMAHTFAPLSQQSKLGIFLLRIMQDGMRQMLPIYKSN